MRIVNLHAKRFVTVCDGCAAIIPKQWSYAETHSMKGRDACCRKCLIVVDPKDMLLVDVRKED